ncbi:MAG TPA: HisA/HisF-related TIM barrel protein [Burkholderiales bacterium]|nr:HisA/HisF-related TIM barrel protein [Burkholderiales bacterium]
MKLIPVVDLLRGEVVHARRGERAAYRAIESRLCKGAQPLTVVRALLGLHPFRTLYLADLDAIQGTGNHGSILAQIRAAFPGLELWVDSGISGREAMSAWIAAGLGRPVIGSESLRDRATLLDMLVQVQAAPGESTQWVLSLDFRGDVFVGPEGLLEDPGVWPRQVLAMNLARVGSQLGPDLELIRRLARVAPEVFAAGGVREASDLEAATAAGAAGALIATALHDGRIGPQELSRYG